MKNKFMNLNAIAVIIIAVVLSSCTSLKTNDFTTQKYTKFKKGESPVAITRAAHPKTAEACTPMPALICSNILTAGTDDYSLERVNTFPLPAINETFTHKQSTAKKPVEVKKLIKRSAIKSFLAQRLIEKPNTASANDSNDAELLLLVILALILPPLAVLLARGAGSEFLLSIILTILFWVPGQIYALLVVFDVI